MQYKGGLLGTVLLAATAFPLASLKATPSQDNLWCAGRDSPDADLRIAACMRLIQKTKLSTNRSIVYFNLGRGWLLKANLEQAAEFFSKSISENPRNTSSYLERAEIYERLKESEKANNDLYSILGGNPETAAIYYHHCSAYEALGEIEKATMACGKAREMSSDSNFTFMVDQRLGVIREGLKNSIAKQKLSREEVMGLWRRVRAAWKIPEESERETTGIVIRIRLSADGRFSALPQVLTVGSGSKFEAMRDSAIRAVVQAQPYDMLREEHYQAWKEIDLTFKPADWTGKK